MKNADSQSAQPPPESAEPAPVATDTQARECPNKVCHQYLLIGARCHCGFTSTPAPAGDAEVYGAAIDERNRLRNTLQGKDNVIAELSRKLEAAEWQVCALASQVTALENIVGEATKHVTSDARAEWLSEQVVALRAVSSPEPTPPDQAPPAKPLTRDDDCPPGGHPVSVYASENGDTLAFPGSLFTTARACVDCGVLINGGPTRCLTCADKPLTRDDVKAIARAVVAEVADEAAGKCSAFSVTNVALAKLAEAAKEET